MAQKFKYNGIENEEVLGLDLYEMPLRQYDPAIARWTSIDPITHHSFSTYSAFDNNPVYWADPSGADSESDFHAAFMDGENRDGQTIGNLGNGENYTEAADDNFSNSNSESSFCDLECQMKNTMRKFKAHSMAFDMVGLDKDSDEYKKLSKKRAITLAMIPDAEVREMVAPTDPLGIVLHFGTLGILSKWGLTVSNLFKYSGKYANYGFKTLNSIDDVAGSGLSFSAFKRSRGGTRTLAQIETSTGVQRISTEYHHMFITQRMQRAYGLPNWLVNNRLNVWRMNTIQHSILDPHRFKFLRAGLKSEVGWFKKYNIFTRF